MARPTKYKKEYADTVYKLCMLGMIDKELAKFFEVNTDTIYEWRKKYPKFSESCARGKELADAEVAVALFQRATGYSHDDTKFMTVSHGQGEGSSIEAIETVKHYPPEPQAAMFWLKNRQGKAWRDKQEVDANINLTPNIKLNVKTRTDRDE